MDTADLTVLGENPNDMVPSSLGATDLNGDGRQDLIVGADNWENPDTETANGQVYVLFGYPAGKNPSPYNQ